MARLDWLPGETLFSFASRYHCLSGHLSAADTMYKLFGHRRPYSSHEALSGLEWFARTTAGCLGDCASIVQSRTTLPFYFPFLEKMRAIEFYAAIRAGNAAPSMRTAMGSRRGKVAQLDSLRACRACMEEDAVYGTPYWHLEHQWPATLVCHRHMSPLFQAVGARNFEGGLQFCLPSDANLRPLVDHRPGTLDQQYLQRLAGLAACLGSVDLGSRFDGPTLARTYLSGISLECGPTSPRLQPPEARRGLTLALHPVLVMKLHSEIRNQAWELGAASFFRRLRWRMHLLHPIDHLVLIEAVFSTWSSFVSEYRKQYSKTAVASISSA